MKLKVLLGMVMSILALTIVGCGGGGGGSSTPVSSTVSGEASKGPIIGGDVKIFAINADGTVQKDPLPTTPAKVTTRAPFGNYSATIGYAGPVKVVVSNGSYTDEATGATVNFTGKSLSAATNVSGSSKVAVTPYTDLAVRAAGTALTPANIDKANTAISTALGLHQVDIIKDSPSTNSRYKFGLAVISQAAGIGVNDLTNLLSTVANAVDVTSGTLNTPSVNTTIGAATSAAFQNNKINPTGTIDGIDPSQVGEVRIIAPEVIQQLNSKVPITVTVKRIDGKPAGNTTVDLTITSGTGGGFSVNGLSVVNVKTDVNGVAKFDLTSTVEESAVFTVHAHPFFAGTQVTFANLDKPATVILSADQQQGITKDQGPITFSAAVTRYGFGLGLGPKEVPDGTIVTFSSTTGTLTSTTATTTGGIATVKLNNATAGTSSVTATAGTGAGAITSAPPVTVTFIDQPVTATLKFSTSGPLPAGVTKITSVVATLSIVPAGVTVKTVPNTGSLTGNSADPTILKVSGVATTAALLPAEVSTVATATSTTKVLVPLVSISGFDLGEFATIVTDVAKGTFPKRTDFTLSNVTVLGLDASGNQVKLSPPNNNVTVDFVLSLQ